MRIIIDTAKQIMEETKELLNLAVQMLCVTRIIKDYYENNMSSDIHCEHIYALSEIMEAAIANVLENY